MSNIVFCKNCVNPSTRPNGSFNKDGICGVCELKQSDSEGKIDWNQRTKEINEIANWGRDNSNNTYDCIVTVSGGKDSMRQAFFARDELGLNPLLVSVIYPPEQMSERGAKNLSNLVEQGFDCISMGLNPQISKLLTKHCLYEFQNLFNATELALYSIPIHVAISQKIPLVFLGENPAHTIGEKQGTLDSDASQMRNANTLMGGSAERFLKTGVKVQDLHFYNYPSEQDVDAAKLKLVYLGYFIKDWSGWNNAKFAAERGIENRNELPEDIGDLWGIGALDEDFRIVNQHLKYLKYGFGHVTDQVMESIHSGMMTREEGMKLVEEYDGKCHPKYVTKLCAYLKISHEEFWIVAEKARNQDVWIKNIDNEWILNLK
jgi:N-acetyl sugar amidotransferase